MAMTKKRKRFEEDASEDLEARITRKLHHNLTEVRKAAKKAKTFETRKLIKNLKRLRGTTKERKAIEELETQLEKLKQIDHEHVANIALKTRLTKDRILSNESHVQAAISGELAGNLLGPTASATCEGKVQNRLKSSKIIATKVARAVEDLRSILQPVKRVLNRDGVANDPAVPHPNKARRITPDDDSDSTVEDDDRSSDNDEQDDDEWESGEVDSVGSSSSESDIESQEDENPEATDHQHNKPSGRVTKPQPAITESRSTFLPSLTAGFTRGDSDASEWSDGESHLMETSFKKNRRGQRARRAIWEKKYGGNANHKKKERLAEGIIGQHSNFPASRPPKRSASTKKPVSELRAIRNRSGKRPDRADLSRSQQRPASSAVDESHGVEQKPLHPSWQAKKKLKEKQNVGILPAPSGKKIKFQ